jgi:hypothetical protein
VQGRGRLPSGHSSSRGGREHLARQVRAQRTPRRRAAARVETGPPPRPRPRLRASPRAQGGAGASVQAGARRWRRYGAFRRGAAAHPATSVALILSNGFLDLDLDFDLDLDQSIAVRISRSCPHLVQDKDQVEVQDQDKPGRLLRIGTTPPAALEPEGSSPGRKSTGGAIAPSPVSWYSFVADAPAGTLSFPGFGTSADAPGRLTGRSALFRFPSPSPFAPFERRNRILDGADEVPGASPDLAGPRRSRGHPVTSRTSCDIQA